MSQAVICIMLFFMIVGIADRLIFRDKFGYGAEFEHGIMELGTLTLSILGIMCTAPILGELFSAIASPIFQYLGVDPAMVAGMILPMDSGGFSVVSQMTESTYIRHLSGVYLASTMGASITFIIPLSIQILRPEDRAHFFYGSLAGFIAIPFSVLVSATVEGIPLQNAVRNLIPAIILAALLSAGILCCQNLMVKTLICLGKILGILNLTALAFVAAEQLLGIKIVPGMGEFEEHIAVIGTIAIMLGGAYPMVRFITKAFHRPFLWAEKHFGINENTLSGMIICLANILPMFPLIEKMPPKEKELAAAFSICASFSLGDFLGYITVQDKAVIMPMIIGKIAGGIFGMLIILFMRSNIFQKSQRNQT